MDDLHTLIAGLRGDMTRQLTELRADMHARFDVVNGRIGELRSDVIHRFEQVDRRFEQAEHRFQTLDSKIDRHFTWVVGMQMALMLAVIGAMVGAYYR